VSCYPILDHPTGRHPVSAGEGGPYAADRFTSDIGDLLAVRTINPDLRLIRNCNTRSEFIDRTYSVIKHESYCRTVAHMGAKFLIAWGTKRCILFSAHLGR
jgi:hypothetical protein